MPAKGDGITKRKDGRYMARYTVHTPDGPKRKTIYGKKYKDVEKKLNEARANADKGLVFDADNLKAGEWMDSWLSDCLKPLVAAGKMAHSTYVRSEGIVNNHLKPALGHRKLKDLTRAEIRRLYNEKSTALSARSVDYIHATLQMSLSQAVRDDLIPRNVAVGERPRSSRNRQEAKALSPAQVKALLTAARGSRNEALYVVAVHTGLRQGELLGLKWTDIDLDACRLSVRRSLKVAESGLEFGSPKNKASRRSVPLNKTAVTALRAHKLRQNEERLRSPAWRDASLVFPNRIGGPTDHNNLYYREYKPLLESAGLAGEGFTFHTLRHTLATGLFSRREHPKVVQSLLGHSSITQTMDTYSHLMDGIGGDAVGGLDEAFS
ncbi:MAG: site-specific integrase [Actinomycetota bacterium]|nr:site-specific integrase [Actinomycetota bacterium]